jgi:hypothetical protein
VKAYLVSWWNGASWSDRVIVARTAIEALAAFDDEHSIDGIIHLGEAQEVKITQLAKGAFATVAGGE